MRFYFIFFNEHTYISAVLNEIRFSTIERKINEKRREAGKCIDLNYDG